MPNPLLLDARHRYLPGWTANLTREVEVALKPQHLENKALHSVVRLLCCTRSLLGPQEVCLASCGVTLRRNAKIEVEEVRGRRKGADA
jgi:hypothetical protein